MKNDSQNTKVYTLTVVFCVFYAFLGDTRHQQLETAQKLIFLILC